MAEGNKITISDVKLALKDLRFRLTLPKDMAPQVEEFLNNPGCPCHLPLYRRLMSECREQLALYFPNMEPPAPEDGPPAPDNKWKVINCHVDELETRLSRLGPGRKQIDVARWEDQVTVVVNELDLFF